MWVKIFLHNFFEILKKKKKRRDKIRKKLKRNTSNNNNLNEGNGWSSETKKSFSFIWMASFLTLSGQFAPFDFSFLNLFIRYSRVCLFQGGAPNYMFAVLWTSLKHQLTRISLALILFFIFFFLTANYCFIELKMIVIKFDGWTWNGPKQFCVGSLALGKA